MSENYFDIMIAEVDLEELYQVGRGLQPIEKKRETREQWLEKYEPRIKALMKYGKMFTEIINALVKEEGITHSEASIRLITTLRQKQEEVLKKGNFNPVKLGVILQIFRINLGK